MEILNKRYHVPLMAALSLLAGTFIMWLAAISPGVEGGMDSYNHYLIARWSWKYPYLLLDQWGKPLYTIIASPFAQFGMTGLVFLNTILLISCAWLVYSCCRKLALSNAWIAFVTALASPIFLGNTISGLTEPLSAFLLLLTLVLLVDNRFTAGALLAGFLPYARSEGYVIMAVVGIYLLWKKEYRAFLFLLAGSVVMNFIGWAVLDDPLWIYNSNPYIKVQSEAGSSCGRGTWLHYVRMSHFIFGRLASILFITGAVLSLYRFVRKPGDSSLQKIVFLILGVFGLYFGIHTLIWKFGLMGSCGYERVMTVIAPLLAVPVLIGFNNLINLTGNKIIKITLAVLFTGNLLYTPYRWYHHRYPIAISQEQQLYRDVAAWFNQSEYTERLVFHLYHYFSILTDTDPYDPERHIDLWSFDHHYAPVGSIVIWDSHFGPNESKIPLEFLKEHPDFREIKSWIPDPPFPTLNSDSFEIHIFERTGDSTLKH